MKSNTFFVVVLGVVIVVSVLAYLGLNKTPTPYLVEVPVDVSMDKTSTQEVTGALIGVFMNSKVGVLLDEIPKSSRDIVVSSLVSMPESFWKQKAKNQLRLTSYRLIFREDFYPDEGKLQLPLPPENLWDIQFDLPPTRETINGHDLVIVGYHFTSTLLSDKESPGTSEPSLGNIGGVWDEPFILPLDPDLLFQRTRFACLDEAEFPPHSVDPEDLATFYDQDCEVEEELSNTGCHQTELPDISCIDALDKNIGKIETS